MARELNLYRLWCHEDSKHVTVWSETEPFLCPENASHGLDTSRTIILDSITDGFPLSDIDGGSKVAVHTSYKPQVAGKPTYSVWTGSGDCMDSGNCGGGELIQFITEVGEPSKSIDIRFHPDNGRVWIHEGYLKFTNGGEGDNITSDIIAEASQMQDVAALNCNVEDDWVVPVETPGTGTHGFAATPVLIPRNFSNDGDWDYDGENLNPNLDGTGAFKISTVERAIHRYINKIPCYGDCGTYFTMSSDETTEVPQGYFIRVTVNNVSNTVWYASVIMEIYRERTANP